MAVAEPEGVVVGVVGVGEDAGRVGAGRGRRGRTNAGDGVGGPIVGDGIGGRADGRSGGCLCEHGAKVSRGGAGSSGKRGMSAKRRTGAVIGVRFAHVARHIRGDTRWAALLPPKAVIGCLALFWHFRIFRTLSSSHQSAICATIAFMTNLPPRDDDQEAILAHLGPLFPLVARESVDIGLFLHLQSQRSDPDAYADMMPGRRTAVLNDRVSATLRGMMDDLLEELPGFSWQIAENQSATEVMAPGHLMVRPKLIGPGRTGSSNYPTRRQKAIRTSHRRRGAARLPRGQQRFVWSGGWLREEYGEDRLWLTLGFELDTLGQAVDRVVLGVERQSGFLWMETLPQLDAEVLQRLSAPAADYLHASILRRTA